MHWQNSVSRETSDICQSSEQPLRLAEIIALQIIDAHLFGYLANLLIMNKLSDRFGIKHLAQAHQLRSNVSLFLVFVDITNQTSIKLNYLRLQLNDLIDVGVTRTKVVDDDSCT